MSLELKISPLGTIKLNLFVPECPIASENILKLSKIGYFHQSLVFRIKDGMAYFGDPSASGIGGTSFYGILYGKNHLCFNDEPYWRKYPKRGLVAMSKTSLHPNSNKSCFFLTLEEIPFDHFDPNITIFGEVVEGFEILDALRFIRCDELGRPSYDIRVTETRVIIDPFPEVHEINTSTIPSPLYSIPSNELLPPRPPLTLPLVWGNNISIPAPPTPSTPLASTTTPLATIAPSTNTTSSSSSSSISSSSSFSSVASSSSSSPTSPSSPISLQSPSTPSLSSPSSSSSSSSSLSSSPILHSPSSVPSLSSLPSLSSHIVLISNLPSTLPSILSQILSSTSPSFSSTSSSSSSSSSSDSSDSSLTQFLAPLLTSLLGGGELIHSTLYSEPPPSSSSSFFLFLQFSSSDPCKLLVKLLSPSSSPSPLSSSTPSSSLTSSTIHTPPPTLSLLLGPSPRIRRSPYVNKLYSHLLSLPLSPSSFSGSISCKDVQVHDEHGVLINTWILSSPLPLSSLLFGLSKSSVTSIPPHSSSPSLSYSPQ